MTNDFHLSTAGFLALVVAAVGYLCYRAMLPRPLPGIPYKKASARRILGDAPDLLKHKAEHAGDMYSYLADMAVELGEPVFQIFMQPMARPWVVVHDPREANDIMTRRIKEFDRSNFFGQIFKTLLPKTHVHLPTGDEWHAHRRLVSDTMSPTFLNQVAGPQMWDTMRSMVDLWREKARLAEGRPFTAATDVHNTTLDIIWAATFAGDIGPNKSRTKQLNNIPKLDLSGDIDKPVDFPEIEDPPAFRSIHTLVESMSIPVTAVFPALEHWLALNTRRSLIDARRTKDELIRGKLQEAKKKFANRVDDDVEATAGLKCALDIVVSKEMKMAQKEGRKVDLDSQAIQDELFTFLIAGEDTTSTTFCWAIKHLTANQGMQTKLRQTLRANFKRAAVANETPSIEEITSTSIPYLDAMVEECPRIGLIAPATVRKALRDTEILGYPIPKDTDVFLMNNGPGYMSDPLKVDEHKRSKTSQAGKDKNPGWNDDLAEFNPERWLDKQGNFNPNAGPNQAFGAGPRGCFGESNVSHQMN